MSKVHVLTADSGGEYTVALHFLTPAGNNSAGVSWQNAVLNSGIGGKTILATGNGPGQITSTEAAQVTAGSVVELVTQLVVDSTPTASELNNLADAAIAAYKAVLAQQLKWFGQAQGTVT